MTVLTYDAHRNECRMKRLRDHYTRTLRQREHTELIERGESIKREWHAKPIPSHRALTVCTVAGVQPARARLSQERAR